MMLYPAQVRRHTAEQLYLSLLALEAEHEEEETEDSAQAGDPSQGTGKASTWLSLAPEVIEHALDCLLVSTWDGTLGDAKASRNGLATLLGVEVKSVVVGAGRSQADGAAGVRKMAMDSESTSYQSLLNDAARGGGY